MATSVLKPNHNLLLSFCNIGYLTQRNGYQQPKSIRFLLKEDTKTLDEVVVIGYGVQKKADLTGICCKTLTQKNEIHKVTPTSARRCKANYRRGSHPYLKVVPQVRQPVSWSAVLGTLNNASPL